jgi:hypothetical protein
MAIIFLVISGMNSGFLSTTQTSFGHLNFTQHLLQSILLALHLYHVRLTPSPSHSEGYLVTSAENMKVMEEKQRLKERKDEAKREREEARKKKQAMKLLTGTH